ncbi:MAG: hypothetical protein JO101_09715 [Candidatus Eremiobacteraeota bacterium]|nr:hypothetical protein [Candidatus Eremiobacteraeota bacterium]
MRQTIFVCAASVGAALFFASPSHSAGAAARPILIGVDFPRTGRDAGEGLLLREAVLLAADDLRAHGLSVRLIDAPGARPVRNPHQDEGSDNGADVDAGPRDVAWLARRGVRVLVGPLRANVALGETSALRARRMIAIAPALAVPRTPATVVFSLAGLPVPRTPEVRRVADAYHKRAFTIAGDDALRTYAAVEIAAYVAAAPREPAAVLRSRRFKTLIGTVGFY